MATPNKRVSGLRWQRQEPVTAVQRAFRKQLHTEPPRHVDF